MEVLEFINSKIREEKGNRVTLANILTDANLDSFGVTVLFMELDDKYNYFGDIPIKTDPFATVDFSNITIKEMVDKCISNITSI